MTDSDRSILSWWNIKLKQARVRVCLRMVPLRTEHLDRRQMLLYCRLSRRCEEYIGEAEDYKLYKIVLEAESPEMAERALFENLCVDVDNNQLNNCGEGKIKALHSDFWKKNVNPYKAYQDEEYQPDFSSNDNDDSSLPPDDEL